MTAEKLSVKMEKISVMLVHINRISNISLINFQVFNHGERGHGGDHRFNFENSSPQDYSRVSMNTYYKVIMFYSNMTSKIFNMQELRECVRVYL